MIQEHSLLVQRHARVYTLGNCTEETKYVWIACHGYGMLGRYFIEKFNELDLAKHFVIVPEALSRAYIDGMSGRVGATWMTSEDRENEIKDYIHYLNQLLETFPLQEHHKIIGFGFSQGVSTISRWANVYNGNIRHLCFWAGSIGNELMEKNNLMNIPTTLFVGDKDIYITPENKHAFEEKFKASKIPFKVINYEGDHSVDKKTLMHWVEEQL
ncbi:MAG: dienelactone hydrolase family protein [Chitinophagales bacterium]|nr:dienelactone hydrolase family protein [Chitinophagales bacterium]